MSVFSASRRAFINLKVVTSTTTPAVTANRRSISTTVLKNNIYEMRTYSIKPEYLSDFLTVAETHIPRRSKLSKLVGYWVSDVGGINEVVHIWQYDSFKQRSEVRRSLQDDTAFENYVVTARPMIQKQENLIMYAFPWASFTPRTPENEGGVYELRQYTTIPNGIPQWSNIFSKALATREQFSKPVGIWFSDIGPLNTLVHMWGYDSIDHRAEVRAQAVQNDIWVNTVTETCKLLTTMQSKILIPAPFSPLK